MIFYFTGTGNSLFFAQNLAIILGEKLVPIPGEMSHGIPEGGYELSDNETLGFVFPVYAWGPPGMVLDFISRLVITGSKPFVFSLCTCGDEEGHTTQVLKKALLHRSITLDSAFSVQMPNNYIIGYDVDSPEIMRSKLKNADEQLVSISKIISERQKGVFMLREGSFPALKSAVINPLFNRFAMSPAKFYATDDCTGCGLCERICPAGTITIQGKPVWGKACTQCLGCLNRCPTNAIQYGRATVSKGRYIHPVLKKGGRNAGSFRE